jgi:glutaredoxin
MIKLYTTHCPKCNVLKAKLKEKNIQFEEREDIEEILALDIKSAPALELLDGTVLLFADAIDWIQEQEAIA